MLLSLANVKLYNMTTDYWSADELRFGNKDVIIIIIKTKIQTVHKTIICFKELFDYIGEAFNIFVPCNYGNSNC